MGLLPQMFMLRQRREPFLLVSKEWSTHASHWRMRSLWGSLGKYAAHPESAATDLPAVLARRALPGQSGPRACGGPQSADVATIVCCITRTKTSPMGCEASSKKRGAYSLRCLAVCPIARCMKRFLHIRRYPKAWSRCFLPHHLILVNLVGKHCRQDCAESRERRRTSPRPERQFWSTRRTGVRARPDHTRPAGIANVDVREFVK